MVLVADHYPDFLDRANVVDFIAPIDFWLANIGQRAVWDCLGAIRFWLTNMLVVRRWARRHPEHYLSVDVRDCEADQDAVRAKLAAFLGLHDRVRRRARRVRRRTRPKVVGATEEIAADLPPIYDGLGRVRPGLEFDDWADGFLDSPDADGLLDRFESFWNTTSHTNLDWAGPVADELVEAVVAFSGRDEHAEHGALVLPRVLPPDLGQLGDRERRARALPRRSSRTRSRCRRRRPRCASCCSTSRTSPTTSSKRAYSALPIRETSLYTRLRDARAATSASGR